MEGFSVEAIMGGLMADFAKDQIKQLFGGSPASGLSSEQINLALAFIKRFEAIEHEIAEGKAATQRIEAALRDKGIDVKKTTPLFGLESKTQSSSFDNWL